MRIRIVTRRMTRWSWSSKPPGSAGPPATGMPAAGVQQSRAPLARPGATGPMSMLATGRVPSPLPSATGRAAGLAAQPWLTAWPWGKGTGEEGGEDALRLRPPRGPSPASVAPGPFSSVYNSLFQFLTVSRTPMSPPCFVPAASPVTRIVSRAQEVFTKDDA